MGVIEVITEVVEVTTEVATEALATPGLVTGIEAFLAAI
jgi:hypothetical protein